MPDDSPELGDPDHDPTISRLRAERPHATVAPDVRAAHRAALDAAISGVAEPSSGGWIRSRRMIAAAAACVVLIGGISFAVLADHGDGDSDLVANDLDPTTPSPSGLDGLQGDELSSQACGGPLPFMVPVGDDYSGPISGPAPGAAASSTDGQLVAHWTSGESSIEVRWPAEADSSVLATYNGTPMEDRIPAVALVGADLSIEVFGAAEGSDGDRAETSGADGPDGTFTFAIAAYEAYSPERTTQARAIWGEEMCGTVQLTVRADDDGDVTAKAARLYDGLIAPGGPLIAETEEQSLVDARTEASKLNSVTACDVPAGGEQQPTESTPVDGGGPFSTADEALAAHIATMVITDEGPFGKPVTTHTVPTAGYTAISLPDGTIAYQFPDIVAYFIASPVEGGWSITRYEGPTC